jgi:uncharacterized protein (DUF302 family)
MEFHYTFRSGKSFDDAVAAILAAVPANGYRVLHVHDVQATFREKGVDREPYRIIEVCNVKNAKRALEADPLVGLMMPCKFCVFTADDATMVSLLRPGLLATFFPKAGLEGLAAEVDADLVRVA